MGFTKESAKAAAEKSKARRLESKAREREFKEASTGSGNFSHVYAGPSAEEVAAHDAAIQAQNQGYPKVELGKEHFDKQLYDKRNADDFDPDADDEEGLKAVAASCAEPGFALKALSPLCIKRFGMRKYEPVLQGNGDPVKYGDMIIGRIPQELADRRQLKAQRESSEKVQAMKDSHIDKQRQIVADARGMGLQVLEPGDQMRGDRMTEITRG